MMMMTMKFGYITQHYATLLLSEAGRRNRVFWLYCFIVHETNIEI